MRRRNEVVVGGSILAALAAAAAGVIWLGEVQLSGPRRLEEARFRSVGGLGVGDAVTLRGVKVGRVEAIRLAGDDWVAVDLRLDRDVEVPADPAAVVTPSTLFGEWALTVVSRSAPFDDPSVPRQFAEAEAVHGSGAWPGATQVDISQLTAKAGQIAGDIATLTGRVETVFDSAMAVKLRTTVGELAQLASDLQAFVRRQQGLVERTTASAERGAGSFATAAARLDSATSDRQLQDLLESGRSSAGDLRAASADIRSLTAAMNAQQGSVIRAIVATDSLLSRLAEGRGTLGMLAQDSVLYQETTLTVRELRKLLADLQANPRKYFKFSVF